MYPVTHSQQAFRSGGKEIAVDRFLPQGDRQVFPAVISLHGSGGGHSSMVEPARVLASQGFAVYVLHYFDRTGTTFADKSTIFRNFPLWMKTLWDAVSHVASEEAVDRERIALMGFSLGAYLALSTAVIDSRIKAVVEFFGGLPKEMKWFMRRIPPVLILHGEADATVPVEEAYHLQQVLEKRSVPYEIKIYPGIGHGFTADIWRDAGPRSVAFLKQHLPEAV